MSSKSRSRSGSTKNKSQQLPSRPVSPSYDYTIQQSTAESKPTSTNNTEYESRLSNLESSMASIQASLNQLLALQMQATIKPVGPISTDVEEVKHSSIVVPEP